jgi:hypothetical protein
VVFPPGLVTTICGGDVNDAYLEYVVLLTQRLQYATESVAHTAAGLELLPDLERLRLRAVTKVTAPTTTPARTHTP